MGWTLSVLEDLNQCPCSGQTCEDLTAALARVGEIPLEDFWRFVCVLSERALHREVGEVLVDDRGWREGLHWLPPTWLNKECSVVLSEGGNIFKSGWIPSQERLSCERRIAIANGNACSPQPGSSNRHWSVPCSLLLSWTLLWTYCWLISLSCCQYFPLSNPLLFSKIVLRSSLSWKSLMSLLRTQVGRLACCPGADAGRLVSGL